MRKPVTGLNGQEIPNDATLEVEHLFVGKWRVLAHFPCDGVTATVPLAICGSQDDANFRAFLFREALLSRKAA